MKKSVYVLMGTAFLLILSACSSSDKSTLEKIEEEGTVTVGFANERPCAYQEGDGTVTGQSVEIARAVFEELGAEELEEEVVGFDSLISGLNSRNFDAVTAGMYITPDRCENAAFAEPEYRIGEGLAVQPGNPHNLTSYEDTANNPDVKVTVMAGAIERDYLLAVGVSEDQIQQVSDIASNISTLDAGNTDAITMTDLTLRTALQVIKDLADQGDMSMILITHEMDFALEVSDRVVFFADGKLVEEGPPEKILKAPESERLQSFLERVL
ncbi:ectoine/hydroxyectoine ABC transporter substrate-binding protein EhuB [Jeotgalibacillus soli]|uniref:ectoine/hydroxyectoine ABC transporter substrate-binding protein EhuB n=1 Tax=Jeotgalibacillus soli TaxID=889306 RepID=UPI000A07A994|nr:ectoine/hydroxyectoine ABC transporter substrate-binding protein EhuB [Jeotgalibacillus soli]